MSEIVTRAPHVGELHTIDHIWETAFGSNGKTAFFDHYFVPEMSCIIEHDGLPVAMGYLLTIGDYICNDASVPCSMIYAVATLPDYRGNGYGTVITRELIRIARTIKHEAVVLCPSTDSLFEYYKNRTELNEWFYVNEQKFRQAPAGDRYIEITEISAKDYCSLREELLVGIPHIQQNLHAFEYQSLLCGEIGGGLFRAVVQGGIACVVVERQQNGAVWIKELLVSAGMEFEHVNDITAAVASVFPSHEYVVRTPVSGFVSPANIRRFGMLLTPDGFPEKYGIANPAPWYGMAFD